MEENKTKNPTTYEEDTNPDKNNRESNYFKRHYWRCRWCNGGPNYADDPQWGRFTVDSHPNADSVRLVLRDENGKQLNKQELLDRLGKPERIPYEEASPADKHDVDVLRNWKLDQTEPIDKYSWINSVNEDGSIDMNRVDSPGAGIFTGKHDLIKFLVFFFKIS